MVSQVCGIIVDQCRRVTAPPLRGGFFTRFPCKHDTFSHGVDEGVSRRSFASQYPATAERRGNSVGASDIYICWYSLACEIYPSSEQAGLAALGKHCDKSTCQIVPHSHRTECSDELWTSERDCFEHLTLAGASRKMWNASELT